MLQSFQWNYYNPTAIFSGRSFPQDLVSYFGKGPILYVTSPGSTQRGVTADVEELLQQQGLNYKVLDVASANPSFEDLRSLPDRLGSFLPEQIIAVGGGSVLDLAKILSYILAQNAPSIEDILNLLRAGQSLPSVSPVPVIACPTTAGTGSEVTPFATLWDMQEKKKYSVAAPNLHPKKAFLFPALTCSLPWTITLSTGLDALSQVLESVWNKNYTPLTGVLAIAGARTVLEELPKLRQNPNNVHARAKMLEASLFSGLCIAQTRTAMAHAISYPLTAHHGTPHGIACSFTLPDLWNYNCTVDDGRMEQFSSGLGYTKDTFGKELLRFLNALDFRKEFIKTINSPEQVMTLSQEMYTPGRADNNLRSFDDPSLKSFLEQASRRWI